MDNHQETSPFIRVPQSQWLFSTRSFIIIEDSYPVSPGHLLIISKEVRADYFDLTAEEQDELPKLVRKAKSLIDKDHAPDGYNIGMNCGATAGQTVFHFHCHVIPRYKGDMEDPRGGVRHCVAGKGRY